MAERIEISFKDGIRDALGEKIRRKIIEHLNIRVEAVKTIEVYTIDGRPERSGSPGNCPGAPFRSHHPGLLRE